MKQKSIVCCLCRSGLVDFGLSQYIIAEEKGLEPTSSSEKTTSARNPVSPCKKRSPVSSRRSNASPPTKPKRKCLAEIQPNNVPVQTAKKPLFSDKKSMDVKSRKMERFEQSCNAENLSLSNTILSRAVEEKFKFMSLTSPRLLADRSRPRRSSSVTIADVFPSIRKYTRSRALSTSADRCKSKTNEKSCNCFGKLSVCYKCLARSVPHNFGECRFFACVNDLKQCFQPFSYRGQKKLIKLKAVISNREGILAHLFTIIN